MIPSKIAWTWILIFATLSIAASGTLAHETGWRSPPTFTVDCSGSECHPRFRLAAACITEWSPADDGNGSTRIRIITRTAFHCDDSCRAGAQIHVDLTIPPSENETGGHQQWVVPACGGPTTVTLDDGTVLRFEYVESESASHVAWRVVDRRVVESGGERANQDASSTPSPSPPQADVPPTTSDSPSPSP